MPSHFQHRFRLSSTSATRFSWYGIVIFLGQALELLIQEDERVSGQRFTHRLFHVAVCGGDHFSAWCGNRVFMPASKKHSQSVCQTDMVAYWGNRYSEGWRTQGLKQGRFKWYQGPTGWLGKNNFGGGHPLHPSLVNALSFRIEGVAMAA